MSEDPEPYGLEGIITRSRQLGQIVRPKLGWIRIVREKLGLTLAELARRLNVTPPAVSSFERAEADDRITLGSLRRVAAALDCELIYTLVPRPASALIADPATGREPLHESERQPETPAASPALPTAESVVLDLAWRVQNGVD